MNEQHEHALDLTNCDREPIHIPGSIQPHGALLALHEPDLAVTQASANLPALLGVTVAEVLGQSLSTFLDRDSQAALRRALELEQVEEANPLRMTVLGACFDGLLHRHQGVVILELEPTAAEPQSEHTHHPLRHALVHVQSAETLSRLFEIVVKEFQQLTAFERVMIYRFDEHGHGIVEAERKDEALDAYLGLRYPASDIPRQARELYLRNWLRIIPDARYSPVGNAIKFTPAGGRVTLRIALENGHVLFAITDTGPGIPEAQLPSLFDRYWQAPTQAQQGTGLGLYIAKGIVEAHGGRIWVELPGGGGASFKFTLPAS